MYKPLQIWAPQTGNAKKPSVKSPLQNISPPPGACTWKIAPKYKVKQGKNGKFTSNYTDFEKQISLRR